MVSQSLEGILTAFVNDELLADRSDVRVAPDTELMGGADVNSLGMMRLIMFIENELDTTIPLADVTPENFASISALCRYLRRDLDQRAAS